MVITINQSKHESVYMYQEILKLVAKVKATFHGSLLLCYTVRGNTYTSVFLFTGTGKLFWR